MIWKPEVEHIEHVPATATGWHRRFCMQPDDFASRRTLLREFETVARAVLGDDADASRFAATGAALDVKTMAVRPRYTGVPAGARTHPKGYWTPDRPMMVDLVARTWHIRSRRWDPIDQVVADP